MLLTIEVEAAECRKAFEGVEVGAVVKNCHHDRLLEVLTEPAEARITYILTSKVEGERARRLREFRPWPYPLSAELSKARAEWIKADAEYSKAYAEWRNASAELSKARAEWRNASAEYRNADAELSKAYAEYSKADAEWRNASAELSKAYAEYSKADADPAIIAQLHAAFPDTTWDGKSIFGDVS